MHSIAEWWMWPIFFVFVLIMLGVDLFLTGGGRAHKVSVREALGWSLVWITMALAFNLLLWWYLKQHAGSAIANEKGLEFLTGYLIEKSLSVDNIFVFLMIFNYFAVPLVYQRRVLLYGILGAVVLRFVMIMIGTGLITEFHWILYLFGAFLIYTGIKMLFFAEKETDLSENRLLKWLRTRFRVTDQITNERFFVRHNKLLYLTPLFLVLILIETSDVVFAVDSIPAIFAVTNDPFIVFTSNIFAILGLRAMYFLLADAADRFHLLKYGLGIILLFIGVKMAIESFYIIPIGLALIGVIAVLVISVVLSIMFPVKKTINH